MQHAFAAATMAALLCACESSAPTGERSSAGSAAKADAGAPRASPAPAPPGRGPETLSQRVDAIGAAVARWRTAADLASARRAAEEARNLVAGPHGPFYGDGDGDGVVAGASSIGLLPGIRGERGLASSSASACVIRDVLGGSWRDPALRWATLDTAIAKWKPGNNTFPALPSHPQRIIGWAMLALATDSSSTARDYARHAQIHVDVTRRAVMTCGG